MAQALQKSYAIVLKISQVHELNGDIEKVANQEERTKLIERFFVERYGQGAGRIEVQQNETKIKLSWFPSKVDSQAEDLHKIALAHAKAKRYSEAVNHWVKAISINSQDPDYFFNLGVAFFEQKNYNEAVENLEKSVQICPIYYKSHLVLGTVYIKQRKFAEAEKNLRETLQFNPNIGFAYLNLGAVYSILKKYSDGITMFEKALVISPNEIKALFGLGKLWAIQGETDKAHSYFSKVIEVAPQHPLAIHAKRAMVNDPFEESTAPPTSMSPSASTKEIEHLYQSGYRAYLFADYKRAIQLYSDYLKRKNDDDFVWFSLGEAYIRAGATESAIKCYKKAININSTKALYFKELAIAHNYVNHEEEVINCLKKAQQLGKNDSLTHTLWGKVLIMQKDYDQAIEHLTQSVKQNPNNLLAKYYLAVALGKTNQRTTAVNYLEEISRSPIDSPLKAEANKLLSQIA